MQDLVTLVYCDVMLVLGLVIVVADATTPQKM